MNFQEHNLLDTEQQSNDRWLISYADLVTLLLALFIVLYAASDKKRAVRISESFSGKTTSSNGILLGSRSEKQEPHEADAAYLEDPVIRSKAKLYNNSEGTVISLTEAGFFAPGEAELKEGGDELLTSIAEKLNQNESLVRIEGHTDSTPISTTKYRSNWELSTARASTVLAKLIERGVKPERLSAAGYGGFRPVGDNSTEKGRARNRRVDVVILKK